MTTIGPAEYAKLSATSVANLVRSGEVTAKDVLEAALERIAEQNPGLNAIVAVRAEEARREAEYAVPKGPLSGVPILLKDLGAPCAGTRSTFGSTLFSDAPPWTHDCIAVSRLRQAGAIILGRSNSGEFGISLMTEPAHYGATHNPWRRGHSAGGSSGGSAAAVAAGIVPIAHGTDGCGSLRVPASHCGLFTLKPSRAVIPFAPDMGESWAGMSTIGGLARSVEDSALFLDVVAGPDPGDPYFSALSSGRFRDAFRTAPARLRIGLVTEAPNGAPVHAECLKAISSAASLCETLGHSVTAVRMTFDFEEAIGHLSRIWAAQLWSLSARRYQALEHTPDGWGMEPLSWLMAQRALRDGSVDYWAAVQFLHRTCRVFAEAFTDFDVLLTPVAAGPPEPLGSMTAFSTDVLQYMWELFRRFPFTVQFNITGRPAMSAPMHVTEDGLPVGVQFASRMGSDLMLLQLARQIEEAGGFCFPG